MAASQDRTPIPVPVLVLWTVGTIALTAALVAALTVLWMCLGAAGLAAPG